MYLDEGIAALKTIFSHYPIDEVHDRSHQVLYEMANQKENLHTAFKYFLEYELSKVKPYSISGDFVIPIETNNQFTLDMGIFSPFNTNYSYAMMHNHDDVRLSTINMFGTGYKSIIFEKGHQVLSDGSVEIKPKCFKCHSPGNIEYISEDRAHTVFYPESLTITLTLWSSSKSIGNGLKDRIYRYKKKAKSKKVKKKLKKEYGLTNTFYVLQDWFYPKDGRILTHPYSIKVKAGENLVHNFLCKLQEIGFEDKGYVVYALGSLGLLEKEVISLQSYYEGRPLQIEHDGDQMITEKRNVHLDEYKKCFPFFNFNHD